MGQVDTGHSTIVAKATVCERYIMSIDPEAIRQVATNTAVLRPTKQALATFGSTVVTYYLLTEPIYSELTGETRETVVRRGSVTADRPKIITPYYLLHLFHGFEHGHEYANYLIKAHGANSPGLMYSYRNELFETSIVGDPLQTVAGKISDQIEEQKETLSAIIKGVDHLWDVSLMKFIYELTVASVTHNIEDLGRIGLLGLERGLPRGIRLRIEEMFAAVTRGDLAPLELKNELDRLGVFDEYEDRFLGLFRRHS